MSGADGAEVFAAEELTELRAPTTTGEFTGDICRDADPPAPGRPSRVVGGHGPGPGGGAPWVFGIPCRGD
ncbi:hypothetical protein [Streptomyces sp. NPDC007856]|uniref:hypothetical protein n=1 Tax=Streptomyces sp. NPDC007856 TaxID=3364781 RepID=UPI003684310F